MKLRSWLPMALLLAVGAAPAARATVYLNNYTFTASNLPYIYSTDSFSMPYKLRAKIQPNYHATDLWNNNWTQLQSVPGPGTYTVELYYVIYAWDYVTVLEIGPRNYATIVVQSATNSPPSIQWSLFPDSAQAGESYYVQALGSDPNGNLTQVNVWKNNVPFAFAGGGNGSSGTSGNSTSDSGGQYVLYEAQAVDSNGATSARISRSIYVNARPTIQWEIAPAVVGYQSWYTIRARAYDADGNMSTVNIYRTRNGVEEPFAFALYGNGANAYSENPDYCDSYSNVTYRAIAYDTTGGNSGSIYCTVTTQNATPFAGWSSSMPGTSMMTSGAMRVDTFIGQPYTFTVSGGDPDNNLQEIRTYEYAWEEVSGTYVIRQNYVQFDTLTSTGGPVSRGYTHIGGTPRMWNYQYVAIARDTAGREDGPIQDNNFFVFLNNRTPAPPTLVSGQSSIMVGQQLTLSAAGTDADQNATLQWLWYRGPAQGPDEWIALASNSYATGTGNTVVNFTFTPSMPGTYYFKTRVDDPYAFNEIVNVSPVSVLADTTPPNAPTNLVVNGVTATWAVLAWTVSNSLDVVEQHLYWQNSLGGAVADILLGKNVAGTSVTNLAAGNSYRMYIKARDGSGNYSPSSSEVTVATPVPVSITGQPQSQTVNVGQNVTFTVFASGTQPITYQWMKNGMNVANGGTIAGAQSQTLSITGVQPGNAGSYTVIVSNNAGSAQSAAAALSINAPPSIITHPSSQNATVGPPVTFSVQVSGTAPFSYQWRKNGGNIAGATLASYTIPSVQLADAANTPGYSVVVSNALGSATSNAATLTVQAVPPISLALQYWQSGDYPDRENGGHWSYDYFEHDGGCHEVGEDTDGDGEDDSWHDECDDPYMGWDWRWVTDTVPDGLYGSRWDTTVGTFNVWNSTGDFKTAVTNRGYLLNDYPVIGQYITFRAHAYAPAGNCNNFQAILYSPQGWVVASSGVAGGGYWQWQFPDWDYGAGVYRIAITYSNATGGASPASGTVSYYIAVGVPRPPTIVTHPSPPVQTVNGGTNVSYSVVASGATSYQWYRNGSAVSGANGATLNLTATGASAGMYRVGAINGAGESLSDEVMLVVTDTFNADDDGDGIPNGIEQLLLTNPQAAATSDNGNTILQLKIYRP